MPWQHGVREPGTTTRGQSPSVNTMPSQEGDEVTADRLLGRGTLRRVDAIGKGFNTTHWSERSSDCRDGRGEGRPETWRTPWPAAGCNKPAECRRVLLLAGGLAAEQTVEAGRNGRDGTSRGLGRPRPKDELRLVREWTQWHRWRRGKDEPQERSPTRQEPRGCCNGWTARTGECL